MSASNAAVKRCIISLKTRKKAIAAMLYFAFFDATFQTFVHYLSTAVIALTASKPLFLHNS
jgi:hypothetical protein